MKVTTLTSPFLLRQYLVASTDMKTLTNEQIFPINAPESTKGNFVTFTATGYRKEYVSAVNYNEIRTVEVELCSQDYDTAALLMMDALRKVVIAMRNAGVEAHITDADEYKYAHVEGGETWNAERVTIELTNVDVEIDFSE